MNFIISDTFTEALGNLEPRYQTHVKTTTFDFQVNPENPGYNFERIRGTKDENFWSIRVNDDIRIIAHRNNGSLAFCYVGHHEDAYDWAGKRSLTINAETGVAQIVKVAEETEVRKIIQEETVAPPFFANHSDQYLLSLGVPPEWLEATRLVNSDEGFQVLLEQLPQDVQERLFCLYEGKPVRAPVTSVVSSPFHHPDAQMSFGIIDREADLKQALDSPLEKWIVFLHPSQRLIVEKDYSGPARVSGAAGTGKSIVALHRAAYLSRTNPKARILLTTYSKTLAEEFKHRATLLLGPESKERERIDIRNIHKVAHSIYAERSDDAGSIIKDERIGNHFPSAISSVGDGELSLEFLKSEWEAIIDFWGITSWDEYQSTSRTGRGTHLGKNQKESAWRVFEWLLDYLSENSTLTFNQLLSRTTDILEKEDEAQYTNVIVDEAQDFNPVQMRFVRSLVKEGANDLFLCRDPGQSIYGSSFPWRDVGIDITGRSSILKTNYRTTQQITNFAENILTENSAIEEDEGPGPRKVISMLFGPPPEVKTFKEVDQEIDAVSNFIAELLSEGYEPQEIAIYARTKEILRERSEAALSRCGQEWHYLSNGLLPSNKRALLGTMHRARGLEHRVVILMGCEDETVPLRRVADRQIDDQAVADFIEEERHLLYVACTRARERLLITSAGEISEFLEFATHVP